MNVARSVTNSMDGEKDNEKLKLKKKMLAQKIQARTHTQLHKFKCNILAMRFE